jgi:hypothetical protein
MRRAFAALGHDVWSCDLLPAEDATNRHLVCDIRDVLDGGWDLLAVMHPPCTRLCNSGVRWLSAPPKNLGEGYSLEQRLAFARMSEADRLAFMWKALDDGAALFSSCWNAPIDRVVMENPVMHRHAKERIVNYAPPAQTVQPWWFGDPAFKATSFYLRGLPKLVPTNRLRPPKAGTDAHKEWSAIHRAPPGRDRWKVRSRTFPGIAAAAAAQWGGYAEKLVEAAE